MVFTHATQSGHTSLETTLLRILDPFGEEPPTGARWHAALIALLPAEIARFRQVIAP